jgi:hypothetical protein
VVHSTAPFTEKDIAAIRRFGEPNWLVEATLMHDTFAKEGRAALPNIPYLAPDGFAEASGVRTESLLPPPREWDGEIDVLRIDGVRMNEHALFTDGRARSWLLTCSFRFQRRLPGGRVFLCGMSCVCRDYLESVPSIIDW